jgi:hypothetical protein
MMKKYVLATAVVLATSGSVIAATGGAVDNPAVTLDTQTQACGGTTAGKGDQYGGSGATAAAATTAGFVKVGFSVQCSANTFVGFKDVSATQFLVGSASAKGNQKFMGSSNGGAVVTVGPCAGTNVTCSVTDSNAATVAASSL